MPNHLESKTMMGLAALLLAIVGLAAFGRLTSDAVDAIKWVGASFMAMRAAATATENMAKK